MNKAIKGPHQPTVHDEDTDDDKAADYPQQYKDLDEDERQECQKDHLSSSVYIAWQALLGHDDAAADRILQKLSSIKCYKINQVPDHLDKIDDIYEDYKAAVEEQRLELEQSVLQIIW